MGKFVESSGFVYNGKVMYKMGTLYKEGKLSSIFKVKGHVVHAIAFQLLLFSDELVNCRNKCKSCGHGSKSLY